MLPDYQPIARSADQSAKYALAPLLHHPAPIVSSLADMDFRFPPLLRAQLEQKSKQAHFGYPHPTQAFWQALQTWVQARYYRKAVVNPTTTVLWSNTVAACHGVIECVTDKDDQVLVMCPVYYYFIKLCKAKERKVVQFLLDTKDNRLHIDFDKLEQTLNNHSIKLLIFVNPWNPCGRIWSHSEVGRLCALALRYKFYILSDEIYSDSVEPTPEQVAQNLSLHDVFTSFLAVEQAHSRLIYVSSYSKTFNSSGLPLCYCICYNPQLHQKLDSYQAVSGCTPNVMSMLLLEVLYTSPQAQQWRLATIEYLRHNFAAFNSECAQKLPQLVIYSLECSYLCLVDFRHYGLAGKQLQARFAREGVSPTFMEPSYETQQPRSQVRLNLAMNRELVMELAQRMCRIVGQ